MYSSLVQRENLHISASIGSLKVRHLQIPLSNAPSDEPSDFPSIIPSDVPSDIPSLQPTVDLQEIALVALYESTNGGSWKTKTNWGTSTSVCSWSGVTCTGDLVTEIRLNSNNLQGTTVQFYFYVLLCFFPCSQ